MTNTPMTPDQEFDFYAEPENQEPQGPARRRHASRLGVTSCVSGLAFVGQACDGQRADPVEHELRRTA